MDNTIVLVIALVLAAVMILAQVRLFSIDKTLKDIRAELASANKKSDRPASSSLNPLSIR